MTINPAGTNYAPNIVACAEIEEKLERSQAKKKNKQLHVLETHLLKWCKDAMVSVCLSFSFTRKNGKKEHMCGDCRHKKNDN